MEKDTLPAGLAPRACEPAAGHLQTAAEKEGSQASEAASYPFSGPLERRESGGSRHACSRGRWMARRTAQIFLADVA